MYLIPYTSTLTIIIIIRTIQNIDSTIDNWNNLHIISFDRNE